jgi:HSP20 family protein
MIQRYDPTTPMTSLRQIMDRLLEDAFVMPRDSQGNGGGNAPLNVYEEGDKLIVEAHMPGVKPEDIDISIERGTLTIRGEIKEEEERKERNYLVREARRGNFVRSVHLPDSVDPGAAQASFENGVLRLEFPRSEQAKPRRIALGSDGRQTAAGNGQTRASAQSGEQSRGGEMATAGARTSSEGASAGSPSGKGTSAGSSSGGESRS